MRKTQLKFNLPISFLKEGNKYIAYTPALDLSTSGKSYAEAKKRFEEAVDIFFEELIKKGTLKEVLLDLGWKRAQSRWNPPLVVSQESQLIQVSV
jgi:predicted RNase H-like HicB family nuclease